MAWTEKKRLILDYNMRMKAARHKERFRREITEHTAVKYFRKLEDERNVGSRLYRSKEEREAEWTAKGGRPNKANWYKMMGYDVTLTIPAPQEESLAKIVKSELARALPPKGLRTLCQEDGGLSIKSKLVRSDPLGLGECSRPDCTICRREDGAASNVRRDARTGVPCWSTGVGYTVGCDRSPCVKQSPGGTRTHYSKYQGETSRTGYTRIGAHYSLYKRETQKAKLESWMWVHTQDKHGGRRGPDGGLLDYKPWILGSHPYPMDRQQEEGMRIRDDLLDPGLESLNSQLEYYKPEYIKLLWSK